MEPDLDHQKQGTLLKHGMGRLLAGYMSVNVTHSGFGTAPPLGRSSSTSPAK